MAKEAGFLITDSCIHCGKCERICPQKCIIDCKINQKHCLHCGLCAEECPVNAIIKKGSKRCYKICGQSLWKEKTSF